MKPPNENFMRTPLDPVVFAHVQCGLEPRNLDGTDSGSCWCLQLARRFG